jgi:RNA polymerase sigma-70 factor (sigma-E family)
VIVVSVDLGDREEETFQQFVVEVRRPLARLAYLLCGDHDLADDLVQNCLIRMYGAWCRIEQPDGVDAYVRRVLLRCWLSERRVTWRRLESRHSPVPDHVDERADPTQGVESAHFREVLRRALAEIPDRQRAAVILRYWSQLSVAETADALRCSEGTVKSQAARGLAALRTALARQGIDDGLINEASV